MDEKLIEAIAVALSNEQGRTTFLKMAQAAIDALKAEGWMLVRWERDEQMDDLVRHLDDQAGPALGIVSGKAYNLVGIEPPAAAITAALKETFKPNPSDNDDKPPHNRGP